MKNKKITAGQLNEIEQLSILQQSRVLGGRKDHGNNGGIPPDNQKD